MRVHDLLKEAGPDATAWLLDRGFLDRWTEQADADREGCVRRGLEAFDAAGGVRMTQPMYATQADIVALAEAVRAIGTPSGTPPPNPGDTTTT